MPLPGPPALKELPPPRRFWRTHIGTRSSGRSPQLDIKVMATCVNSSFTTRSQGFCACPPMNGDVEDEDGDKDEAERK